MGARDPSETTPAVAATVELGGRGTPARDLRLAPEPTIESTIDPTPDPAVTAESVDSLLVEFVRTPGVGGVKPLAPGTVIDGQYRVERAVGQGGMGVVYLARDLRLDRDVALKLGHVVSDVALRRIEREAMALARLQHPNVVVIHQVGETDGRLYIAMEHVGGGNAREWLAAEGRAWRAIVAMYAAAGDGLAAAHAAGFVHRDFKPDNVLVDKDGRPRVADFGLVRGLVADDELDAIETLPGRASVSGSGRSSDRMTETGTVVGTPAYMAPEQIVGGDIDARADQFAFCAALWEALFGERAYRGRTPGEVAAAIARTTPRPPDGASVSRHVVAALRRGLARDRDARWPSMAPLVAELRRDLRGRRRVAMLAAGTAVLAAGAAVVATRAAASDPCDDGAERIGAVWNPARAAELGGALDHAGASRGWPALHAALDRYASAWAVAHDAACHATRVDGSQSEAIMDQRELCLTRARAALDAMVGAAMTDRDAAATTSDRSSLLPDLARCSDTASLAAQTPLPADPVRRAQIDATTQLVEAMRISSLHDTMRDARGAADHVLAEARRVGWPPLIAQAALARADLLYNVDAPIGVVPSYREAARLALAAGDDETAAWALADLAIALADGGKPTDAASQIELARGLGERLQAGPALEERIQNAIAEAALAAGDPDAAIEADRRRIDLAAKAYGNSAHVVANDDYNLSVALFVGNRYPEAERAVTAAIDGIEQTEGSDSSMLVNYLERAAQISLNLGDIDRAIGRARRAVAIARRWYAEDDSRVANAEITLGTVLSIHGDLDEARTTLERALAVLRATQTSTELVAAKSSLAIVEARTGHDDRAVELASELITEQERDAGPDNLQMEPELITRGISLRHLRRYDESRRDLEHAIAVVAKALGSEKPEALNARIELSYTLVAQGRAADAVAALEPWMAAMHAAGTPSIDAEAHTALADALWRAGGDRARARSLAQIGLALYDAIGDGFDDERAAAKAWLDTHK